MEILRLFLDKIKQLKNQQLIVLFIIILGFIASIIFVNNNHSFYSNPIVKITHTELIEETNTIDNFDNQDVLSTQELTAEIMNGDYKGDIVTLVNDYSIAGAYDQAYSPGNELFVSLKENNNELNAYVKNVKRDKYLVYVAWIFILILIFIGKRQGLFAVLSLIINALVLSFALDFYINNNNVNLFIVFFLFIFIFIFIFIGKRYCLFAVLSLIINALFLSFALDFYINNNNVNLLIVIALCVIFFTISSLLLVNGFNEKTYAAIVASLIGTFISVLIAYLVLTLTNEEGLRYEAMDFLTRPYKLVFMAGVFVGSLGAVMDVAITMSASIFELYEKDNKISIKALKKSANDIGKDIMGTMTNILFFAYLSGSIPI